MPHPIPLAELLGAPVYTAGARVGVVTELYAGPHTGAAAERLIGVEVAGPTGHGWYLPWPAAILEGRGLRAASPLVFLPLDRVASSIEQGIRLEPRRLTGLSVDETGAISPEVVEFAAGATSERSGVA